MNRGVKTKISTMLAEPTSAAISASHKEAQQRDAAAKAKQKEYADKHRRIADVQYKVQQKKTITKPPYDTNPVTVTHAQSAAITATRKGKVIAK